MPHLLLMLFGAMVAAGFAFIGLWPLDLPEMVLYVTCTIFGTLGGAGGLAVGVIFKLLTRGPTKADQQRHIVRPVQVVGQNCAVCDERIMFVADGHCCQQCGKAYCRNCEPLCTCSACARIAHAGSAG